MIRTALRLVGTSAVHFRRHGGIELAGYLAFLGILSLFPFLFFFVAVAGFFGGSEAGTFFVAFIFEQLPDAVASALEGPIAEIFQTQHGGLLTIGVAGAVWTATTGLEGLRVAVVRAEGGRPKRAHWRRRLQSLIMVAFFAGVPTLALLYIPFGWAWLKAELGLTFATLTPWFHAGAVLAGVSSFVVVWVLYYVLPDRRPKWYRIIPGALLVVSLCYVVLRIFARIVEHMDSYALIYGSLAGVVLALLLFYIFGAIFIFGAELNTALRSHLEPESKPPAAGSGH